MSELVYTCPCVPDRIRIWNCWFLRRGENRSTRKKNLLEQGREPTTNSTHIWRRRRDLNPGHIGGRRALSPLRHPCPVYMYILKKKYCVLVYCVHLDKVAFSIRDIFMSSQSSKTKCSKASMRFWSNFTPSLPYTFCIRTKTG